VGETRTEFMKWQEQNIMQQEHTVSCIRILLPENGGREVCY